MIEVEALGKEYGAGRTALASVSFTAQPGEVVGLLGPNGAGKTTLLRVLAGVLFPTTGSARLCGHDVVKARRAAQRQVGYLPEQVPLDRELRVGEYLRFRARLKRVAAPEKAVAALLAEVGLAEAGAEQRLCGELSKGFRQRVGLLDALLHRPRVLLLDEPTDGLDPNQRAETLGLIRRLAADAGHTVLLSTHVLPEVEAICQRVVVLDRGRVVAAGTPAELAGRLSGPRRRLDLLCRGEAEPLVAALAAVPGVARVDRLAPATAEPELFGFRVELSQAAPASTAEALAAAVLAVGGLRALQPAPSSLESVFRFLTAPISD